MTGRYQPNQYIRQPLVHLTFSYPALAFIKSLWIKILWYTICLDMVHKNCDSNLRPYHPALTWICFFNQIEYFIWLKLLHTVSVMELLCHILALSLFLSESGFVWVTPCYHDNPRDPGGCPVQCGPAGGAAPPGPAAMHRAASLLYHVPGTLWHRHRPSSPSMFRHFHCAPYTLVFCRQTSTPTLKTGMHLWPASPAT